jgi:flagellar M-ring protein FliF
MEALRAILKQISAFWAGLSNSKRFALVGLTTSVLVAVLLVSYIGNHKNYAYLYTNLEPQDASAIVEKLKTTQVPYRIDADGRAILVPEDRIAPLRLELASTGLPRGNGVGFELFDRSQLGATEFEQNISLRRALEGELTRSIMTIQGVQGARVHLVMPERRLFVAKELQPSASVVLKLTNASAFGKRETAGIVHLISAAVPGLHRDRVSVVSTDGVTLHRPNTGESGTDVGADEGSSERAQAVASQLEAAARSQLERVVGVGNAEVRIAVDLDTSAKEKVEEHYEPSKTALRSENRTEERNGTGAPGVAGVPGALTNLPDARQPGAEATEAPGAPDGATGRLSQTRNWEVDKVSQKTTTPPGEIERLSISVLLNDKTDMRDGNPVPVPRSQEELAKLEELIKRTVGFNLERGDSLKVDSAPFMRAEGVDSGNVPFVPAWRRYLPYILSGIALLAFAIGVLVWRNKQTRERAALLPARRAVALGGTAGELNAAVRGAAGVLTGDASTAQLSGSHYIDGPMRRARALQMANDDPATAAIVIRKWLNAAAAPAASARL